MKEPIHDFSARDTSMSKAMGRLKDSIYTKKRRAKNSTIKKILTNKKYGNSK